MAISLCALEQQEVLLVICMYKSYYRGDFNIFVLGHSL